MTLSTEHTVDPTVLMLCDTHIIDIRGGNHIVGHGNGLVPETEVIDTVGRLGHCEETLTVGTFYAHHEHILAVPLDGTGVQGGITHDALHQIGVVLLVEVIFPLQGHVGRCQNRVLVLLIDAITPLHGFVLLAQQFFMMLAQSGHLLLKFCHILIYFFIRLLILLFCDVLQEQRLVVVIKRDERGSVGLRGRRTEPLCLVVTPGEQVTDGIVLHSRQQGC